MGETKALHKSNETTGYKGCTLSKLRVLQSRPRINVHSLHKTIPAHCHHHWLTDQIHHYNQQSLELQNSVLPKVKMLPYSIILYACVNICTHTHTHTHTHTIYTCMHTPFTRTRSYLSSMTSCLCRNTSTTTALGSHL